jgi:transcription antitermination factor NusG
MVTRNPGRTDAVLDVARSTELANLDPDASLARCGSHWAVVQTHPQAERWANANLTRQGYATYLPLAIVRRRDRAIPSLYHRAEAPLFGNYLFVVIDRHWAPIAHTRGVLRLLMANGKPGIVARAAVEALQAAQADRATQPPPNAPWAPGTACSLTTGPLRGHPAVVLSVRNQHARLSVMLFGALRDVSAPVSWLVERQ